MLIGIHGKARYGKDTVGKHLESAHGFHAWSFADPIWRGLAEMFDLHPAQLTGEAKEELIQELGFSPREGAQELGTGWGRNTMGRETWIRVLDRRLRRHYAAWPQKRSRLKLVITDVRFDNEADWIREHGGEIWHLVRPDAPKVRKHESEDGIQALEIEPLIYNDHQPGELIRLVDGLMQRREAS